MGCGNSKATAVYQAPASNRQQAAGASKAPTSNLQQATGASKALASNLQQGLAFQHDGCGDSKATVVYQAHASNRQQATGASKALASNLQQGFAIQHDGCTRDPFRPKQGSTGCLSQFTPLESLVAGSDSRTPITFNGKHKYGGQQLEWECGGSTYVATGHYWITGNPRITYVLTCAHNVVSFAIDGSPVTHSNMFAFDRRYGPEQYAGKVPLTKAFYHPKYNGDPACGYDIAVCVAATPNFDFHQSASNFTQGPGGTYGTLAQDYVCCSANPGDIEAGLHVEISGYPGEQLKCGYPYIGTGEVRKVVETKLGGWILMYNVDTTPGNSGSNVVITDTSYVGSVASQKWKGSNFKVRVAVHTGTDVAQGLNYGTLITEEIGDWIRSTAVNAFK